jgi:hypothetical protein
MDNTKFHLMLMAGILILASIACGELSVGIESSNSSSIESNDSQLPDLQSTDQLENSSKTTSNNTTTQLDLEDSSEEETEGTKRYRFEQLGISLEIPSELCVIKNPTVRYEDQSKLVLHPKLWLPRRHTLWKFPDVRPFAIYLRANLMGRVFEYPGYLTD